MPIQLKNSTKIDLHIRYFVKIQYFVSANLVCTNKKSNNVLRKFYPDFKKHSGYFTQGFPLTSNQLLEI